MWAVAIKGARMDNSVSEALFENKRLGCLYTDLNRSSDYCSKNFLIRKLQQKIPRKTKLPTSKIKASLHIFLKTMLIRKLIGWKGDLVKNKISLSSNKAFTEFCIKNRICDYKNIYAMNGAALEIFESGDDSIRVLEQCIVTKRTEIENINKLIKSFGRENILYPIEEYMEIDQRNLKEINLADLVICPSEFVLRDVLLRAPKAKVVMIPYGVKQVEKKNIKTQHSTNIRKIITVGAVGFRKGSPIIWKLAEVFYDITFELYGPVNLEKAFIDNKPENIVLKGVQPYEIVSEAYLNSDLFLLPSVAEGSATVIYEAASHGLPIACSNQCGSVLRSKIDAEIFDAFDYDAIVKSIRNLNKAALRQQYASSALEYISHYSKSKYQERLMSTLIHMEKR